VAQHIFERIDGGDHVCSVCKQASEDCIDVKANGYTSCPGPPKRKPKSKMPGWFASYLESLPDYEIDELVAWTKTSRSYEEFFEKLKVINT